MNFENAYDYIIDMGLTTKEAIDLVCDINGSSLDTINDIIYATQGYNTLQQYLEFEDYDTFKEYYEEEDNEEEEED